MMFDGDKGLTVIGISITKGSEGDVEEEKAMRVR